MIDAPTNSPPLLEIRDLTVEFRMERTWQPVVEDLNLAVYPGETLGLVGESGCGKSTLAFSVMRLHTPAGGARTKGRIFYRGRDLLALDERSMRGIRGADIAMIPQDPFASLNPLFTIGNQIREVLRCHGRIGRTHVRQAALHSLERVRLDRPEQRLQQYPHELSGGMRQRAVGAIAVACGPRLLIADEPTTALDVTVQAEYLEMLEALQQESELSMLFISHDLGVIARMCDRVAVMYAGRIVESGRIEDVFHRPAHWYTRALLESTPSLDRREDSLSAITGSPPRPGSIDKGCRFAPRCAAVREECRLTEPRTESTDGSHEVRCWYPSHEPARHD